MDLADPVTVELISCVVCVNVSTVVMLMWFFHVICITKAMILDFIKSSRKSSLLDNYSTEIAESSKSPL